MSLGFLFHYLMLNMFRMLIHPISGASDLFVELFHGLYCSGSMRVGVTLWFGWGGVVSVCRLKQCFSLHPDTNTTHEITQQISRKLLRINVLTSETCWDWNNKKNKWHQVGLFIQQPCQLRCLMTILDNYLFRPLLAIFRLSSRELKLLLYIYSA